MGPRNAEGKRITPLAMSTRRSTSFIRRRNFLFARFTCLALVNIETLENNMSIGFARMRHPSSLITSTLLECASPSFV